VVSGPRGSLTVAYNGTDYDVLRWNAAFGFHEKVAEYLDYQAALDFARARVD